MPKKSTKRQSKKATQDYKIRDPLLRNVTDALRARAKEPALTNPCAIVDWAMRKGIALGMKLAADVITDLCKKEER